jgi:hypothetical protein
MIFEGKNLRTKFVKVLEFIISKIREDMIIEDSQDHKYNFVHGYPNGYTGRSIIIIADRSSGSFKYYPMYNHPCLKIRPQKSTKQKAISTNNTNLFLEEIVEEPEIIPELI